MKRILIVASVVLIALAFSCKLSPLNPFLGADQAAETALMAAANTNEVTATDNNLFYFDGISTTTFSADANRTFIMYFDGGVVDAASVATAVTINQSANAADVNTIWAVGAAIPFTSTVIAESDGTYSQVVFSMNLNVAAIANQLQLSVDPATLTANGGKHLDGNGNNIGGEAGDLYFTYMTVTPSTLEATVITPTALTTGAARMPYLNLNDPSGSLSVPANAATTITFTYRNVTGIPGAQGGVGIGAATFSGGLTLEKWVAGVWTAQTYTAAYVDTTNVVTITFPAAAVTDEIYRWTVNPYNIVETAAVRGDIHRANNDPKYVPDTYQFRVGGNPLAQIDSIDVGGQDYGYWIDLFLDGGGRGVDVATLTADSVKIRYGYMATTGSGQIVYEWITWAGTPIQLGPYSFRFLLPSTFALKSPDSMLQIGVNPLLKDQGPTTVATDDISYGNLSDKDATDYGNYLFGF